MAKPAFDPSQPFQPMDSGKPKFDPSMPFDASGGQEATGPSITQEMHPAFSTADRLVVKNLSNNNEAAVNYLQKKHPDLQVAVDDSSGQIIARKRDGTEKGYKVLDPDTGFFSKDFLYDAGDILGDVVGGVGSTAATAAGAVAGGLPGAVAGGAASSAGIESLRQALGKAAGVDQQMDLGQIGLAGAVGAANPLLFGTGVAGVAERGLIGDLAQGAKSKLLPKIGESLTGVPKMDIATLAANPTLVDDFLSKGGALGATEDVMGKATKAVLGESEKVGSAISGKVATAAETLDGLLNGQLAPEQVQSLSAAARDLAPEQLVQELHVDVSKLRQPLVELRNKYAAAAEKYASPENLEMVQKVQSAIDHFFPENLPERVSPEIGQVLKKKMDVVGKAHLTAEGTGRKLPSGTPAIDQEIARAATEASKVARDEIDRVTSLVTPDGRGTKDLNSAFHQIQKDRDYLDGMTSNPKSAWQLLSNVSRDGKSIQRQELQRIDARYGSDLLGDAQKLSAAKHFADPSLDALSGGGSTSTTRTLGLMSKGAALGGSLGTAVAGPLGGALGGVLGASVAPKLGSPAALLKYIQAAQAVGKAGSALPNVAPAGKAILPAWFYMHRDKTD